MSNPGGASIEERVIQVVCQQLKVEPEKVTPETTFVNDLRADSLDLVELVMEIENEFSLSIPEEDSQSITSVGDVINYVKEKTGGG